MTADHARREVAPAGSGAGGTGSVASAADAGDIDDDAVDVVATRRCYFVVLRAQPRMLEILV